MDTSPVALIQGKQPEAPACSTKSIVYPFASICLFLPFALHSQNPPPPRDRSFTHARKPLPSIRRNPCKRG